MQKLTFGDTDLVSKKKRQPSTPEKLCAFQTTIETLGRLMKPAQCKEPALSNDWCEEHKHAQAGMSEGERLGWRGIEVPMCACYAENSVHQFTLIIGPGKKSWLAYFERARDPGLSTVLRFLEKQV